MSGESEVTARAATVGRNHREHSEPYCEVKNVCLDVIHVFQEPSVRSTLHRAGLLTRDTHKTRNIDSVAHGRSLSLELAGKQT